MPTTDFKFFSIIVLKYDFYKTLFEENIVSQGISFSFNFSGNEKKFFFILFKFIFK